MNTVRWPQRRERDLKWFFDITLSNLGNCYMHLKPGTGEEEFVHEILRAVDANDDPSIEEPIQIVMSCVSDEDRAKGPDWISHSPYGSIVVATAYCLRAGRAMRAGDGGLAWSHMSDARYWAGVAISSKGIDDAREHTIVTVNRERGVAGAAGKDKKLYAPIRQFAYEMAWEKKPSQIGWQSRNHAVETIKSAVLEFARSNGVRMSDERARKTIDGWLANMPDAATLFPEKKNSKRKNGVPPGIQ